MWALTHLNTFGKPWAVLIGLSAPETN